MVFNENPDFCKKKPNPVGFGGFMEFFKDAHAR